ncbi:alpha-1,2-mannosidase, putative [Filimonas lacunae]|uniref:Alpha-1,2-mannosidase, putative n=1 Tax=Filimonas lacunae TaxID=477680 RepID=A0A173MMS7_9BACT|nr:GH92 family glycosyl hydrolase [Filimonas lacunae]BAV08787.1 alpha-1,2-mannosidase [Filimonas lacunae]SIS61728.1 alpha-1,2-mannosidase, putative [Filimonas lacunae]
MKNKLNKLLHVTAKVTTVIGGLLLGTGVQAQTQKLSGYINPFIGTGAHGHTYPGPTVPFGMVQLSPDNGTAGWDWCSGYHYSDSVIAGFSHTHLSGTGIGDLADISVLPSVNREPNFEKMHSAFSHATEKASAGYYSVMLDDFHIKAELTTSERTGYHRYTFPKSEKAMIRFNLGFAINWDKATETHFKQLDSTTFIGYRYSTGWAKDQRVYFAVRLSKPVREMRLYANNRIVPAVEVKSNSSIACLLFSTQEGEQVQMQVSLSFANEAGALDALNKEKGWAFDKVKEQAVALWEKTLSKVAITTANASLKEVFYTALYHAFEAPVLFSDVNGNYKNVKGNLAHADYPVYTVSSLWDVFRAESPLFTLLQPERVPDIIHSYMDFYNQYGLLPVWDLHFNETNCMTGYHCIPIVADAVLKGMAGVQPEVALEAMKKSAMQNIRGANWYREYGYLPQDKMGSSVTITLEYAYDDWCIAQVAKKLGKEDDYALFMKRSASWKSLFDSTIGFARAKNADGSWVTPFDPYFSEHDEHKAMFTEGNSWQHSWFVPQDVKGLMQAYGGVTPFVTKLDSLFTVSSELKGENTSPDISGLVGQYAHGNEPSHHIAYLYNYAGMPAKTADRVRYITQNLYTNKPDGLCGNEDCGQMSAWFVWSALGFYPVNPASGEYAIGAPLFDKVSIQLPRQKKFTVIAKGVSNTNRYIQKATLNGKPYTASFIKHTDIVRGGELVFTMGSTPSATWGVKALDLPGQNN